MCDDLKFILYLCSLNKKNMPYKTDGIEIEIHPGPKKGEDVAIYTSQRKITQRVKKRSRPSARIYTASRSSQFGLEAELIRATARISLPYVSLPVTSLQKPCVLGTLLLLASMSESKRYLK